MNAHNLFYYPYASFTNGQLPLMKVAALYFDKLFILDPVGASAGTIGDDYWTRSAVGQLQDAGILETVAPADVLAKYAKDISEAIRQDMRDRNFLDLCEAHASTSGEHQWRLSLAKVPQDLQSDEAMRHLMGDFSREMAGNAKRFSERPSEYLEFTQYGQAFDGYREGYDRPDVEYRSAELPLALGESIMMNHALFAGLLHTNAAPITDDPFHTQALSLKLHRAAQSPAIQQVLADRESSRNLRGGLSAVAALTDSQLNLPALNPQLPLEEVLEYRHANAAALQEARDKLGWIARRIRAEPWSEEFAEELEHDTIPGIAKELDDVRKARDAWLDGKRGRLALSAAGLVVGTAAAVLGIFVAPLTPVVLAASGLGMISGTAIPGAQWWLDWRDAKKGVQENGLHYLMRV